MLLLSCFLLVACLFIAEKNVVIGRKNEGFGVEKKEIFSCVGGAFCCKKMELAVEKISLFDSSCLTFMSNFPRVEKGKVRG